ncbi:MAG: ABC transporter permease [Chloroflexota bacterium]|nr:ABC transporter permease [Chloroflexota bacterium]
MNIYTFTVRRLLLLIPVLVGITLVAFVVSHAVPADPIISNLGQRAQDDPSIVGRYRHQWGLDQPLPVQYGIYVRNLLHGDLGVSITSRRPVTTDLRQYFPATLELSTAATLFSLIIGIPLGVLAAVRRNRPADHISRVISLIGISTPVFWLGLLALILFYYHLGWFPGSGQIDVGIQTPHTITGMLVVDSLIEGDWQALGNSLWHLVLPAVVLGSYTLGIVTRMTRGSMLEVLTQDYIRTARAKGLRAGTVVFRHGLRNAIMPTLTLVGLAYGSLLSGAVLTETIFSWPGIGRYATTTAGTLDFPAIMGVALLTAFLFVILNLIVDVLYGVLNPQIRFG